MRLAVVTGATGFTGPYVVRALRQRFPNLAIRCVVRSTSPRHRVELPGVSIAVADLRDPIALPAAFEGADVLVNVASLGFDWTDNVIQAAQRHSIERGVFLSTTAILTALPVPSKPIRERAEAMVRSSKLAWTILRPTMIYGTMEDRNIARLIRFVNRSLIVPLPAPDALQQPVHVEDVAWAVAAVLQHPATVRRAYNLSGRDPLTLRALVREVANGLCRRRLIMPLPLTPVIGLLRAWSRIGRPPLKVEQLQRMGEDKAFDHKQAAEDFGFSPRSFRDGVDTEIVAFRQQ